MKSDVCWTFNTVFSGTSSISFCYSHNASQNLKPDTCLSLDIFYFYFITANFFSLWLAGILSECLLKVHCCEETVFLMGGQKNSDLFCPEECEMNSWATGNAKQWTMRHPTVSLLLLVPSGDGSSCSLEGFCFFGSHYTIKWL